MLKLSVLSQVNWSVCMKFLRQLKQNFPTDWFTRIILVMMLVMGAVGAVFAYRMVNRLVASTTAFSLPGDPILPVPESDDEEIADQGDNDNQAPQINLPDPDPWDGTSRVNVLVMGLDLREDEDTDSAPRSDTMILLSMDPLNNTATGIAIPRDMWVAVPGFGYYKINTAYRFGELYDIPGGGPELASQAVEEFLGVPVHFYAQIDFQAFVDFIDHINGIKVTLMSLIRLTGAASGIR
jgi:polyisoprenyl-teichoic acid--peptidoglycan teichoic acid transferase